MTELASQLSAGNSIASRYKVERRVPSEGRGAAVGRDEQTGSAIGLLELRLEEVPALRAASGVEHPHLASILDLVEPEGSDGAVLITEQVTGQTLGDHVRQREHLGPVDAARMVLRIADGVLALHQAGGAHGCLHPDSVIVVPEAERSGPVLAFWPWPEGGQGFVSRAEGQPPSESDDCWALGALLYFMLIGEFPPAEGLSSADELAGRVGDPELRELVAGLLAADPEQRCREVKLLRRQLARWFAVHAGEEEPAHGPGATAGPPPLPARADSPGDADGAAGQPPAVAASKLPAATPRRRMVPALTAVAVLLGLGASWAVSAMRQPESPPAAPSAVASAAPEPSAAPEIDLGEVAVTGESEGGGGDKMASCVAAHLPSGTFDKPPRLQWLCELRDPRDGAERLRSAVVSGSSGRVTEAMRLFSRMGWYDMAAFAVVRVGCCAEAPPVKLPQPAADCPATDEALAALAEAVIDGSPFEAPLDQVTEAMQCEVRAGRGKRLRHRGRPNEAQRQALNRFVEQLQSR